MNKWMKKLMEQEGAIKGDYNPFAFTIESPSPSVNFTFGNSWGLPLGYSAVIYGPPKEGKSVLAHLMAGQMQRDFPDGMCVKFDTEYRTEGQLNAKTAQIFGIDFNRFVPYEVNQPELIFDRIEGTVAAMCQDGAPIKLCIIDSLYGIQGRRAMNAESVNKQQIGDHAATIQDGLKRILPIMRKHRISLIMIDQVRSEMDQIEQMRGNKFKLRSAFGVQHHAEYFMAVEENKTKEGRADISGQEFVNDNMTDLAGKGERTGMKIRVKMRNNSMGPKLRTGEFTFDFQRGVVNIHEEVFKLGVGRNAIKKVNAMTYGFGDKTWKGKDSLVQALKESPELQANIIKELKRMDLNGDFATIDANPVDDGASIID